MYYDTYYNNPRTIQDESYNEYYMQRKELYDQLQLDYNIINIKNLAKFTKFDYNIIPHIYTYDIEVNKNFKTFKNKINHNSEKIKIKNYINEDIKKDNTHFEIEEEKVNEDVDKDIEEKVKKDAKQDKCTEKKIKECKEKGKVCNPDSGRCVAKLKKDIKEKFQEEVKQDIKEEVKQDIKEEVKQDKCTEKKIKECKEKGKVCNPDSGRCVAKLKK
jgi:hypothetical protein